MFCITDVFYRHSLVESFHYSIVYLHSLGLSFSARIFYLVHFLIEIYRDQWTGGGNTQLGRRSRTRHCLCVMFTSPKLSNMCQSSTETVPLRASHYRDRWTSAKNWNRWQLLDKVWFDLLSVLYWLWRLSDKILTCPHQVN